MALDSPLPYKKSHIVVNSAFNSSLLSLLSLYSFFCCVVFATAPYMASGVDQVIDSVTDVVSDTVDVVVDVSDASSDLAVAIPHRMDLVSHLIDLFLE